jgi:DNA-binding HxlR family transcriptional regulator
MRQTSFAGMYCSLAQSLERIGDWWTPLIIRDLYLGLDRFEDLAVDLGISRNLLTTRLTQLVEDGIIERERYSDRPPRDRYVLAEAGRDLVPIIVALTAWGDKWATPPEGPPVRFRHRLCGHRCTPVVACSHCGEAIDADELDVLPGPGGRVAPGTMLVPEMVIGRRAKVASRTSGGHTARR